MNKSLLKKLFPILETHNIPYILIGGYAAAIWGNVRATKDIDFLLKIPGSEIQTLIESLERNGFQIEYRRGSIGDPVQGVIRLKILLNGEMESIELILGIKRMPEDIFQRSETITLDDIEIPVISPEDLIILKLMAGGPIDLQDARYIKQIMTESLDFGYLDKELSRRKLSLN